ncbi:MAG: carbonic anhydrase [Rhodospirillales bacterium]|nr:carbonic anhydrase [Rhodospirillales bacterium]MYE19689.1 carbonic anhydrase [Rhodospirillales bacterium]
MTEFPTLLLDGFDRFKKERFSRDHSLYRSLAEHGQTPAVMVIACCDSRTAPETIFQTAPGELFVVRNVANLVPPHEPDGAYHGTSAALEFAVQSLRVRHIVVLGHGGCGGIRAALRPSGAPLSPDDFIGKWMSQLRPIMGRLRSSDRSSEEELQTVLERASVRNSITNLRSFPYIANLEDRGELSLHGAWFDIAEGELWTMNPSTGEFATAK